MANLCMYEYACMWIFIYARVRFCAYVCIICVCLHMCLYMCARVCLYIPPTPPGGIQAEELCARNASCMGFDYPTHRQPGQARAVLGACMHIWAVAVVIIEHLHCPGWLVDGWCGV